MAKINAKDLSKAGMTAEVYDADGKRLPRMTVSVDTETGEYSYYENGPDGKLNYWLGIKPFTPVEYIGQAKLPLRVLMKKKEG